MVLEATFPNLPRICPFVLGLLRGVFFLAAELVIAERHGKIMAITEL